MARKKRTKQKNTSGGGTRQKKNYTVGEIFGAILGGAFVILMGGIILTAILGD